MRRSRGAVRRRSLLAIVTAASLSLACSAYAQDIPVKIGVLTDMSGVYADLAGPGSVVSAQLAVEDFEAATKGLSITIISADHQNKPDVGSNIARTWFDREDVSVIVDVPTSSVSLAVADVAAEKNKAILVSGGAAEPLTLANCKPTTVHWTYDTYALSQGVAKAIVANGGDSWFFLTGDFAAGYALEEETSSVVTEAGGQIVGSVKAPLGTADYSSFLLQASASGAKVIAMAITGNDLITAVKQAAEFGVGSASNQTIATLIAFISDIHGLGLSDAQGLTLLTGFYWDRTDESRAFASRFAERMNGAHPTMVHAGVYSATLNYLKAVADVGDARNGAAVVDAMKAADIQDPLFDNVVVAANGRTFHDMFLARIKSPDASQQPWDYYEIVSTLPAVEAFRPVEESGCPLVK